MSCVLRITSLTRDFSAYAEHSPLPVYHCHRKGDEPEVMKKRGPHEDFALSCDVSERDFDDFRGQVADAIAFLNRFQEELGRLWAEFEVTEMWLDFGTETRMLDPEVACQYNWFPADLIRFAGALGVGICLSQYPPSLPDDESEEEGGG